MLAGWFSKRSQSLSFQWKKKNKTKQNKKQQPLNRQMLMKIALTELRSPVKKLKQHGSTAGRGSPSRAKRGLQSNT